MYHLGRVLHLLCDLSPDYRCRALDAAQEFFNANSEVKIAPTGVGYGVLEHKFPGLDPDYDDRLRPATDTAVARAIEPILAPRVGRIPNVVATEIADMAPMAPPRD